MGPRGVVGDEEGVERLLHLFDGLEPGPAAFDAEVLVEERAMEALDDPVGLRPADLGFAVLDAFELKEQLVGRRSGRPQNSRPLSDNTVLIGTPCSSKKGTTSVLSRCTAVSGILLV